MKTLLTLFGILFLTLSFGKNVEWTCLKEDGSVAFRIEADRVYNFNDGMAPVRISKVVNNKWVKSYGFVDANGTMIVAPQYEKVKGKGFVNGRAWVKKKDSQHWTLINKKGEEIPTKGYMKVGYIHAFMKDLLCVYEGDYFGFIDRNTGKEVIPCKYIGSTTFHEGLACVTTGDGNQGYGFINEQGATVIPMQFKQGGITIFMSNGWCRAGVSGKTVLIDKTGKTVFKTNKGNIQGMSNGWVRVFTKNDRTGWGFIDLDQEWKIQPTYDDLDPIRADGLMAAQKNGLWGVIDTNENVILDFKFATLYFDPEDDGYIMGAYPTKETKSLMDTPKSYYNSSFEEVDMTNIKYIYPADGGAHMPFLHENGMKGYLDRDFKVTIPARYTKAKSFSDGLAWVR